MAPHAARLYPRAKRRVCQHQRRQRQTGWDRNSLAAETAVFGSGARSGPLLRVRDYCIGGSRPAVQASVTPLTRRLELDLIRRADGATESADLRADICCHILWGTPRAVNLSAPDLHAHHGGSDHTELHETSSQRPQSTIKQPQQPFTTDYGVCSVSGCLDHCTDRSIESALLGWESKQNRKNPRFASSNRLSQSRRTSISVAQHWC